MNARHSTPARPRGRWLAAWLATVVFAIAAVGRSAPPPGHDLFTDGKIRTFKIDVVEPALGTLKKNERAYVPATLTVEGKTFKDVGVHLKGMGSFQSFDQKPSLAVKFDRYTPDQEFHSLSKIFLNNSAQDGTYLAELMATQMFRDAGVPAARVTHAFVELNGRKPRLYVLIEAMNKDFLRQHFKKAGGNLYEAYLQDIDQQLDLDSGVDNGQADLKRLLEVCRIENSAERWSRLPEVLDVDKYLSHCALEMMVAHTDGYALNRNNYRLYHDPATKRFTMITHGLDWGFANTGSQGVRTPVGSIITRAVIGTPEGRKAYRARQEQLFTNLFRVELFSNRVATAVAHLKAAVRDTNEASQFEGYGRDMLNKIVARYQNVSNQLAGPEPQPLRFDAAGVAQLTNWRSDKKAGNAAHDITQIEGKMEYYIKTSGDGTIGSWRSEVILPPGKFRFTGEVRTAQVIGSPNDMTPGACLRISGDKQAKRLTGDSSTTKMEHEFEITVDGDAKELVCDLRAKQGEAWFDAQSLRLVRVK